MKIAIVCTGAPETLGGETIVAIGHAQFTAKYHDVALIATSSGERTREVSVDGYTRFDVSGLGTGAMTMPNLSIKNTKAVFDFLDKFKPDIVHAHSIIGLNNVAQIWAKMHEVPFFYTTHELPSRMASWLEVENSYVFSAILGSSIPKTYLLPFYDNCTAIVALNDVAREDMIEYGYRGDLYVVPNGRDFAKFSNLPIPDIRDKEKRMIFVGTMGGRKNQEFLIKMMKYLPKNYKLTLVGRYLPVEYEEKIKKMVGNDKRIDVVGPVDPEAVPDLLSQHHLVVSASKAEVQALSIIEGLASATPIVGLSNETIDELVDDTVGIALEKSTSPKEFARAVESVLSQSKGDYDRMAKQARKSVERLDWDLIVRKIAKIYELYLGDDIKPLPKKEVAGTLAELLETLPEFKSKSFIVKSVKDWRKRRRDGVDRVKKIGKIPPSTFAITGFVLAAFAALYGGMKLANKVKKKPSK